MQRRWTALSLWAAYVVVIGGLLLLLPDRSPWEATVPAMAGESGEAVAAASDAWWMQMIRPSLPTARRLLSDAIPGLTAPPLPGTAPGDLVLYMVTGARLSQPQAFFQVFTPALAGPHDTLAAPELPPVASGGGSSARSPIGAAGPSGAAAAGADATPVVGPPPPPSGPPVPPEIAADAPLVGIYHTHDWESYVDMVSPGTDPLLMNSNDPARDVIRVGKQLAAALLQHGIPVVNSTDSHQKNGYLGAYGLSRDTARQLLSKYPSIRILIDLHRDALPRDDYVTKVDGQVVAKFGLVIGSGMSGLPQPRWPENRAFAVSVCAAANARYAGLCRGVLLKQDRYNQDLMPGAILIEVGTSTNTMAEALRAVDLLGPVLADLIRAGKYPSGGV